MSRRIYGADGEELDPMQELSPDEYASTVQRRAEDYRTGRRHVARYWPNEDTDQARYEQWVTRDA